MPATALARQVERAHLAFALRLHQALVADPTATLCWSPFSVTSALGLAATGARGATRTELTDLILGGEDADLSDIAAMCDAASQLTPGSGEAPLLGVANTLWARPDIPIGERFAEQALSWPNGAIADAPFDTDPNGARRLINDSVSEATHGLISQLIPAGALDSTTIATLVNALYLKTAWQKEFPARDTADREFAGAGQVPTMRLRKRLGYASGDGWQVIALPAAGGVQGVVLLPDGDLAAAEAGLTATGLAGLLFAPAATPVDLYLPKFRVTTDVPLTASLGGLGVRTMFGPDADFGEITSERLRVDDVVHQAVLTIDEQGLEGAAATAVTFMSMAMVREPPPIVVRVDRPFLFLVRHSESGAVYFLARVTSPRER